MSGGPAILASGEVAGVNVATAGNAVSFLVPAVYARELLERAPSHPVNVQLSVHQEATGVLQAPIQTR